MYEDNRGALFMANAQQTSQRTRHIDIKTFALIDWVEQDLMTLMSILTADNCSDSMTKALAKTLFYRHNDTTMGRRIPAHVQLVMIAPDSEATSNNKTRLIRDCSESNDSLIRNSISPQNTGG
jgi:hypothetical protein